MPFRLRSTLLLAMAALLLTAAPARAQNPGDKRVSLLEASGYHYKKAAANVYTVSFDGKNAPGWDLFVAAEKGFVVVGTVLAHKAEYTPDPPLLIKLLRANDEYDRVKVAIDDDGDLSVRVDLTERLLDTEEFKADVEQVALSADEIYGDIKQYLQKK